jgi:hypothetical protein
MMKSKAIWSGFVILYGTHFPSRNSQEFHFSVGFSVFKWDLTFLALLLAGHGGFNLYRP